MLTQIGGARAGRCRLPPFLQPKVDLRRAMITITIVRIAGLRD
jgi:hypothetical protein